jgi:hypothetical protein
MIVLYGWYISLSEELGVIIDRYLSHNTEMILFLALVLPIILFCLENV